MTLLKNKTCILIAIFLAPAWLFIKAGTTETKNYYNYIGIKMHKGFIIPHSESVKPISHSKPYIIEADYSWHFNTSTTYSQCLCHPRIGISAAYINFENPEILGNAYTLSPYIEPHYFIFNGLSFSLRFLAGFAYLNNIYHQTKNPTNYFYSTRFCFMLSASAGVNYQLLNNFNLNIGTSFNHISNGGNYKPNYGINFPTFVAGINYTPSPAVYSKFKREIFNRSIKKSEISLAFFGTLKKPFQDNNTSYLIKGLAANYSFLFTHICAIIGGIEYINDLTLPQHLQLKNNYTTDHRTIGLLLGHEFRIKWLRLTSQAGFYGYSPYKHRDKIYQRWGVAVVPNKWVCFGVNIKAHRNVADFLDFRIGFIPY